MNEWDKIRSTLRTRPESKAGAGTITALPNRGNIAFRDFLCKGKLIPFGTVRATVEGPPRFSALGMRITNRAGIETRRKITVGLHRKGHYDGI